MRNVVQLCLAANNIQLMRKRNHAFLLLAIALAWEMPDRFAFRRYSLKNKLGDRMIEQLVNSVIARYRDLSVSRRSVICLSLRLWQISYLLAIDKSWYFAQPCPIIVNYSFSSICRTRSCRREDQNQIFLSPGILAMLFLLSKKKDSMFIRAHCPCGHPCLKKCSAQNSEISPPVKYHFLAKKLLK